MIFLCTFLYSPVSNLSSHSQQIAKFMGDVLGCLVRHSHRASLSLQGPPEKIAVATFMAELLSHFSGCHICLHCSNNNVVRQKKKKKTTTKSCPGTVQWVDRSLIHILKPSKNWVYSGLILFLCISFIHHFICLNTLIIIIKVIIVGMFEAGKTCSVIPWDLKYPQTSVKLVVQKALNECNLRVLEQKLKKNRQTKMYFLLNWPYTELIPVSEKFQHANRRINVVRTDIQVIELWLQTYQVMKLVEKKVGLTKTRGEKTKLISSAIQLLLFFNLPSTKIKKALGYDAITVLLGVSKAVSLPCHHDVQPCIMVTRCQLQAEGHSSLGRFRDRLGGEWQREWLIFQGGKRADWLADVNLLSFQALFCVFVGVCLRDPSATNSHKPRFYFLFCFPTTVIKTYAKVWLATKFLFFQRVAHYQGFYSHSQSHHNIKKEYQGHKIVTIADIGFAHFKTEHNSWRMNHIIFLIILQILLEFKYNLKKIWMRKRYIRFI
ncbi:hypothetical protein VP01_2136g1 [Puccinia sorghi]|uniref:Uncharacterized protein n=1 Tax=Puccinia sorghi TaxID=27349 RepID=A0A0L6VBN1_9BASI|nr:hypothetical protein VP01_2136g1 [Puccinia sorghi]